jgi:asparagine synthase (glutamine-hydrolysing)
MSGIFGIAEPRQNIDLTGLAAKMATAMSHRDWYVAEHFVNPEQTLAIGRLGIGIFNRLPQPIWNDAQTLALVMAGEFYDSDRPRDESGPLSDEALALSAFERWGDTFASHLNGVFIVTIWHKAQNRLVIANDRFGLYPLYLALHAGRLLFAPEVKGILCDETFPRTLDLTALAQYMRFQHLLSDRTFFQGISLFPPASTLVFDLATGVLTIEPYWVYGDIPDRPKITFNDAVQETGRLLRRAVQRLSGDHYRPGVYLSGGLDARTILGLVARRPVASLTFGDRRCSDVNYARQIARAVGSDHHWFDLPDGEWVKEHVDFHLELTEGFHSWIHAHGISTLLAARQLIDVNLTGWDGGTVLGHPASIEPLQTHAVDDAAFIVRQFHLFNQKFTWPSITEAEEHLLYTPQVFRQISGLAFDSFRAELAPFLRYRPDVRGEFFFIANHCRRLTQHMVTFGRSHIEFRFPYFDYELIDFVYSIPAELRASRRLYRAVIQREIPRLAYIPYNQDEFLPTTHTMIRQAHSLVKRFKWRVNKHIFRLFPSFDTLYADYEAYLRAKLREWAEGILFDQRLSGRGLFDPEFLRSLIRRHLSGLEEWTIGKIAPLITFEMMMRRFFDDNASH